MPLDLCCPITHGLMCDPVMTTHGQTYERDAIETYWHGGSLHDPLSNLPVFDTTLTPNFAIRSVIQRFTETSPDLVPDDWTGLRPAAASIFAGLPPRSKVDVPREPPQSQSACDLSALSLDMFNFGLGARERVGVALGCLLLWLALAQYVSFFIAAAAGALQHHSADLALCAHCFTVDDVAQVQSPCRRVSGTCMSSGFPCTNSTGLPCLPGSTILVL